METKLNGIVLLLITSCKDIVEHKKAYVCMHGNTEQGKVQKNNGKKNKEMK